jgi:hypothetical protein
MVSWPSLLALLLLAGGETRRESWPGGGPRAEYEVEVRSDGRELRSGAWRSWHEDGTLASEGRFAEDRETGRWMLYHPGGAKAAEGSFARGERTGVWETFHADGARASKGRYEKGERSGEWSFWDASGVRDARHSGSYEYVVLASGGRTLRGARLDDSPHGEWRVSWPDGAPMLAGTLVRGRRFGDWRFTLPDGSTSALLSGRYEDDVRSGPLPEEAGASAGSLPEVQSSALGWPAGREAMPAAIEEWIAEDPIARRKPGRARPSWSVAGPAALPVVLGMLLACDPESAADRDRAKRLEREVLQPLAGGHVLAPLGVAAPATADELRAIQHAWAGLWAATHDDTWFWFVEVPCTRPGAEHELLRERPFRRMLETIAPRPVPPALFAARFEPRDTNSGAPLVAALDWLLRAQLPDGRWSATLDGTPEMEIHDPGMTALALLALLGAGLTPADTPAIEAGLGWLLGQQDAKGMIPRERRAQDWIYDHIIATFALCEAQALAPREPLRARAQAAVDLVLAARNPEGAWGYDLPPTGEADTSITVWAVNALFVARVAGLEGDFEAAFEGALGWIDEMTEPTSGRIGYNVRGSYSARNSSNERFPREHGEALTAAGLFARRLLGVPQKDALVAKQIELLEDLPPLWDAEVLAVDEYYLYYGAQALAACASLPSKPWQAGLQEVARHQSGNASVLGSWDPVGPWAYCGGRVYSTALLTLALEAPFRYALPDAPAPGKKNAKKR